MFELVAVCNVRPPGASKLYRNQILMEAMNMCSKANGMLSLDEFAVLQAAFMRPMTVRAFQMHATDGDSQVIAAETAAMMQSQMAGPLQEMPGTGQGMMSDN